MKSLTEVMGKQEQGQHLPNAPNALQRQGQPCGQAAGDPGSRQDWAVGDRRPLGMGAEGSCHLCSVAGQGPHAGPWCKAKRDAEGEHQEVSLPFTVQVRFSSSSVCF